MFAFHKKEKLGVVEIDRYHECCNLVLLEFVNGIKDFSMNYFIFPVRHLQRPDSKQLQALQGNTKFLRTYCEIMKILKKKTNPRYPLFETCI